MQTTVHTSVTVHVRDGGYRIERRDDDDVVSLSIHNGDYGGDARTSVCLYGTEDQVRDFLLAALGAMQPAAEAVEVPA